MSLEFLKERTDLSVDELKQLIDDETDVKRYKKLHFIQLKKEGYTTKEAYELANLKKTLAYLTLKQWQTGGYNALIRKPGGGRSAKLNSNQLKELEKNIQSQKFISAEEVQDFIKKKWNVDYTITGIKNLLKSRFNITLNQNKESINELTDRLEKHLKNVEKSEISEDNELNRLKQLISQEKNIEVSKKLYYLILRCLGFSNKFSSTLLGITTVTGSTWKTNWKQNGYDGLKRKKGQGRKKKSK